LPCPDRLSYIPPPARHAALREPSTVAQLVPRIRSVAAIAILCALAAGCASSDAKVRRTDVEPTFPPVVRAEVGGEETLTTELPPGADRVGYRIRYRIVDGPPAALTAAGGSKGNSLTEAVSPVGSDGTARVTISQPAPTAGDNLVAIDVIEPDRDEPDGFAVVSRGETTVRWVAPELGVNVSAPKTAALNQEVLVSFAITTGPDDAGTVTVAARVPAEMHVVRTEPKAVVDGDQLVWTLPVHGPDRPQTVEAVLRPVRSAAANLTAHVRAAGGKSARGSATVQITEPKLLVKLAGPRSILAGDPLPFQVIVTNVGDGPADDVRVRARLDNGRDGTRKQPLLDESLHTLGPRQTHTFDVPIPTHEGGRLTVEALASAAGGLVALPAATTIDVHEAALAVSLHGPARGYVGQEVTWRVAVRNTGDVPLNKVTARVTFPSELKSVRTTHGGRVGAKQITWELGTLAGGRDQTVEFTGVCDRLVRQTAVTATGSATPSSEHGRSGQKSSPRKPIAPDRPADASFEILGIPALQLSIKDSQDPVAVGQRTNYTIRVKNAGTLAARQVVVTAEVPTVLRPIRASGPEKADTAPTQRIAFPPIESLGPNAEATFTIDVEGATPGEGRVHAEVRSALLTHPLRADEPTRVLPKEILPPAR
jgi:uncharacterized repeat protein (TIGR01451 family)